MENKIITIRRMNADDARRAAEIEKAVFSEPWKQQDFEKAAESTEYICLAAADGDDVVAYLNCTTVCDEADITNIAVAEKYRRMGIADKLIKVLIRLAGERMIKMIFLEVRESNEAAMQLYCKNGFVPVGTRRDFYRFPTENAVVMKKIIYKEENE